MMKKLIIILFPFILTSCIDENQYVIKPMDMQEVKVPYSLYQYQTYFSLSTSEIVGYNSYDAWDLGFESSTDGYHIILNASRFMYAGNTKTTDFYSVQQNIADTMLFDNSSGNLDSTAIGQWLDNSDNKNPVFFKHVYIIDRGVDELGNKFGFKKIVFEKLENDTYYFRFSNLDNSDEHEYQITKNPELNFVLFSFDNGGNTDVQQPPKDQWDICFTKYTSILYDNNNVPTPYIVRGALINPNGISVAKETVKPFDEIKYSDVLNHSFLNSQDGIGYDWKIYKDDKYFIVDNWSYIIHNRDNNYYKLRFTGFYNNIKDDPHYGEKGYISFEMTQLNP